MKSYSRAALLYCFLSFLPLSAVTASTFLHAPHDEAHGLSCKSCHEEPLAGNSWPPDFPPPSPAADDTFKNFLCLRCHDGAADAAGEIVAPKKGMHSALFINGRHQNWTTECTDCHDPHFQGQMQHLDDPALFLAFGAIQSINTTGGAGDTIVTLSVEGTSQNWLNMADWTGKNGTAGRGLIFITNDDFSVFSGEITQAESSRLTVAGTLPQTVVGKPYGVIYGALLRDRIRTPAGEERSVRLFDPRQAPASPGALADERATTQPEGVCQVCHTQTAYWRSDGSRKTHNSGQRCTSCHAPAQGFAHSAGQAMGENCVGCHGHDSGYSGTGSGGRGSFASHSTHTENDSDDARGPNIACDVCHDPARFPTFKSGTDSNGDGLFSLAETDVCNPCHSPGGSYDGVNDPAFGAKANWRGGIYETNGETRAGKELWCISCHDNAPAVIGGAAAPNKAGDGSSYGYYLTGHGATGGYRATLHGRPGPAYACAVCHDTASSHISGVQDDSNRLKIIPDDAQAFTSPVTSFCLDCHLVGKTSAGVLGHDATAEASIHSGAVSGKYNTAATTAFPAYGNAADYAVSPGYQCEDCHELHGTAKLAMIRPVIDGRVGGVSYPRPVLNFEASDADLKDLDPTASANDGVCDLCHTNGGQPHPDTSHAGNHNQGNSGSSCLQCHSHKASFAHGAGGAGADCSQCHGHDSGYSGTGSGGRGSFASHSTHTENDSDDARGPNIACDVCHDPARFPTFKSGTDSNGDGLFSLAETDVCNPCHSPGGSYDGVNDPAFGAKANWRGGIYETNGEIRAGKEKWCATCHDNAPAVTQGINAPNVIGDEDGNAYGYGYSWGYYRTGHKFNCLNCHDSTAHHIDGEHRTYEVINDGSTAPKTVPVSHAEGYRLARVKGKPAMIIPLNPTDPSYNILDSFALCFKCHKKEDVMGANTFDRGRTNFFNSTSGINAHNYHVPMGDNYYDSDWDITSYSTSFQKLDSAVTCVACHNVHGAPNQAMVRHGELISAPGTTNAVPAFNMNYVLPGNGTGAARFTPTLPGAGSYEVFAYWASLNGRNEISRAATNAPITISYNGGTQSAQLTKDLRYNCCSWKSLGVYTFTGAGNEYVEITSANVDGTIIADGMKWVRTDTGAEVVMDEEAASYLPSQNDWNSRSNPGYSFNDDYLDYGPILSKTAPVEQSVAGTGPGSSGPVNNRICTACHYSPVWHRAPNPLPLVIPLPYEDEAAADGAVAVLFGAWVKSPGGAVTSVTIDLSVIGGSQTQTLYDDGTHGDVVAGDNLYSFAWTIPDYAPSGTNTFHIVAETTQGQSEADLAITFGTQGEVIWDNDSGDGLWSTPSNWSTNSLPAGGDKVVFNHTSSTNCFADTIPAGLTYLGLNPGYNATLTLSASLNGGTRTLAVNELRAYSGKLLLKGDASVINEASGGTASKPHGAGLTIKAANVIVGPGGYISADGQGFGPQAGPGASSVNWASGGSYGGFGTSTDAIRDTFPYGSITEPTALGSGGATASSGGSGGGAMKLVVSDTVTIRGTVSAAGINADGGGSGGSVWIIASRIKGEGTISARGGYNAYRTGGGGRISLQWDSGNFDFNGLITAEGASGATNGTLWVNAAGGNNPWAEMWNASRPVKSIVAIPPGDYYLNDLRIANGANIECMGDRAAANAASGGTVSKPHGTGVTIHSNNIMIEAGGILSADGMGFYPQQGPGSVTGANGGASYGGFGIGVDGQRRTFPYGTDSAPTALGSGGGSTYAGPGGGAIKLNVSGTATVDGTLSATGHGCKMSGAGSGGSIWIVANTIAGSGVVNANGGDDYWGTGYSGGGGRIRLEWQAGNYLFNGIVKAEGPDNSTNGTLTINAQGSANPWQEIWNGARHVTGSVALVPGVYDIAALHIDSGVSLDLQGDRSAVNEASGGTPGSPHGAGVTINSDNITIASGGALSADGLGFRPQEGPGSNPGNGASHGGYGYTYNGYRRNLPYGSYQEPTALGSGGGSHSTAGLGGGAIKLNVSNTITIDGSVSANGHGVKQTGSGAGGSIWITADAIAGSGNISANGGYDYWNTHFNGGGGRISLKWTSGKLSFNGPIRAEGYNSATNGTLWVQAAGSSNPWNELWNENRPASGNVALVSGSYFIDNLIIPNGVRLDFQGDDGAGSWEGAGVSIYSNNISIESGATIRADGLGFRPSQGPGGATASGMTTSGASHGGAGSSGATAYGSSTLPVSLGSGGGDSSYGGPGGGAIKLSASSSLNVNGTVSAKGDATNNGGGSGGVILLIADTLAGAGSITANGGSNGGGGGRIAVHYNTDNSSLSGNLSANGGGGGTAGGNGTIVFEADADTVQTPSIKNAFASDASGSGAGIQAGDQVVITFSGQTDGAPITSGNINAALPLSNGHSWLDGLSGIQSTLWSTTIFPNDTLTVRLSVNGGTPAVAPGDVISMGGIIKNDIGNSVTGSVSLGGVFDTVPAGAVAYWTMNEGSGSATIDLSGNNNYGALRPVYPTNAPSWNPAGYRAGALSFDGVNDYVDAGNRPSLNPTWREPFSLDAWVKFDSLSGWQMLITKIVNGGSYRGWQLCKNDNNKIAFYLVDDFTAGRYLLRTSSNAVTTGAWHHVVVSYDGGTTGNSINIYLNDILDQTAATDGANAAGMTTIANTESVKMGIRGTASYPFRGTMDEVFIYR